MEYNALGRLTKYTDRKGRYTDRKGRVIELDSVLEPVFLPVSSVAAGTQPDSDRDWPAVPFLLHWQRFDSDPIRAVAMKMIAFQMDVGHEVH